MARLGMARQGKVFVRHLRANKAEFPEDSSGFRQCVCDINNKQERIGHMAKKEIRMILAKDSLALLIDRGASVDVELKNLTFEDKGIKSKINEQVVADFAEGEQSLRFDGKQARALISKTDTFNINTGAESFTKVKAAVDAGLLKEVVDVTQKLSVPPAHLAKAAAILTAAGIPASLTDSYEVEPEAYRALLAKATSTVEEDEARKALAASVEHGTNFRVKYEAKELAK
jgi:hypothetical protein